MRRRSVARRLPPPVRRRRPRLRARDRDRGHSRARASASGQGGDQDRSDEPRACPSLRPGRRRGKQRHGLRLAEQLGAAESGASTTAHGKPSKPRSRQIARSTGASPGRFRYVTPDTRSSKLAPCPASSDRDVVAACGRPAPRSRPTWTVRPSSSMLAVPDTWSVDLVRLGDPQAAREVGAVAPRLVEERRGHRRRRRAAAGSVTAWRLSEKSWTSGNGPPWTPVLAGRRSMPRLLEELAPGGVQGGVVAVDVAQVDPRRGRRRGTPCRTRASRRSAARNMSQACSKASRAGAVEVRRCGATSGRRGGRGVAPDRAQPSHGHVGSGAYVAHRPCVAIVGERSRRRRARRRRARSSGACSMKPGCGARSALSELREHPRAGVEHAGQVAPDVPQEERLAGEVAEGRLVLGRAGVGQGPVGRVGLLGGVLALRPPGDRGSRARRRPGPRTAAGRSEPEPGFVMQPQRPARPPAAGVQHSGSGARERRGGRACCC